VPCLNQALLDPQTEGAAGTGGYNHRTHQHFAITLPCWASGHRFESHSAFPLRLSSGQCTCSKYKLLLHEEPEDEFSTKHWFLVWPQ